jgi:hypothetical protein
MRTIMADKPDPTAKGPGIKIAPGSSEQAPFIYFDGAATYGVSNGAIQIELAANTIMPEGTGTRTDVLITAHLRCSPAAAMGLRDAISRALEMTGLEQTIQPIPHSKPN